MEIPDFCLAVVIGPDVATGPFLRRAFGAGTVVRDLASAQARLADRALAAMALPDGDRGRRGACITAAKRYHAPPVALILEPDPAAHTARRLRHLAAQAETLAARLPREGFAAARRVAADEAVARVPLPCDRRAMEGPFDVVGDVHGHADALRRLLSRLGYVLDGDDVAPPPGRRAVFVGDLVDRGPASPEVLRLAMGMVRSGAGLWALGNHDRKLARALAGRIDGDAATMDQMAREAPAFRDAVQRFLPALPSHLWLAGGRLVVVHAAIRPEMVGRDSKALTGYALHGPTTGRHDGRGHPIRQDWVADHDGATEVIHGHVPTRTPAWRNGCLGIDTGCGMGGRLTALRWPEGHVVSVPET